MSIIEVRDLHYSYDTQRPALRGLDLAVERGSVLGLLGRNGSGKTTLLRILIGLMRPADGEVRVLGGDPIIDGVSIKRRIGYVSEDQILPAHLSLKALIRMYRALFPTWDDAFVDELISRFRLPSNKRISALSKGQARQVALLCAIGHRPELLILDEPGSGVDPVVRRELLEAAIALLSQSGSTILFSSHHVTDVERLADRIVVIDDGRVALDAQLDALKESHCLVRIGETQDAADRLREIPGCLSTRLNRGEASAVFAATPEEVMQHLTDLPNASATSVPLEDLFIQLVGGES